MPDDEANSSPIRMPSSVTAMPMRTPERISGMAAGASTVAIVAHPESRSAFAVRRCTGATLRTAFMVKMATGNMPWMTPNAICAAGLRPKINRMIG